MCSREMANVNKLLFDIGFTQKQADCRWICCYGEPQGVCEGWYSTSLIMNSKAFISPKPSIHSLLLTHTSPRERLHRGESVCVPQWVALMCLFSSLSYFFSFAYTNVCLCCCIFKYSQFERVLIESECVCVCVRFGQGGQAGRSVTLWGQDTLSVIFSLDRKQTHTA